MNIYRPRSVLRLILLGFLLVALPLTGAAITGAVYVNRLANQSQQALLQVVQATQNSRSLLEQLSTMERHARQFLVLGNESLFHVYAETHRKFQRTRQRLSSLPLSDAQRRKLHILATREQNLFEILRLHSHTSLQSRQAVAGFNMLTELAQSILAENNRLVDKEVGTLQTMAGAARRVVASQTVAVIPTAFVLMALFTAMIARPIRQIDAAIRHLGGGDLSTTISVTGPQDLEFLGQRLDWLRVRLQELEAAKTKFVSHVSHELKTPLSSIREGATLLLEEVAGPLNEQQREVAEILMENGIRLQQLIEDLLNFSVAQARNAITAAEPVAMDKVVEAVCEDHMLAAKAKDISLRPSLGRVVVCGDRDKLRVIVDNLLSNAIKYSPCGGVITVALRRDGAQAILDVRDTGPGILPADRPRLFEAFYQGHTPYHGHIKGTGLGLSILREYVLAHGGQVEIVESETPGAHFRVTLPLTQDAIQ